MPHLLDDVKCNLGIFSAEGVHYTMVPTFEGLAENTFGPVHSLPL